MCCSHIGHTQNRQTTCHQALICHRNNALRTRTKSLIQFHSCFRNSGQFFTHGLNRTKVEKTQGTEHSLLKASGSLAALEKSLPAQTEQGTQAVSSSGERNDSTGSSSRERLKEYLHSWGRDLGAEQGCPQLNGNQILRLNPSDRKGDKTYPPRSILLLICKARKFCQTARHKITLKLQDSQSFFTAKRKYFRLRNTNCK